MRVGLILAAMAVGLAHDALERQLPDDWDAQQVYDDHQLMMKHGQKVYLWRTPQCQRCVMLDIRPTELIHRAEPDVPDIAGEALTT